MIRDVWFCLKIIAWGFFHPLARTLDKDIFLSRQYDRWDSGQW